MLIYSLIYLILKAKAKETGVELKYSQGNRKVNRKIKKPECILAKPRQFTKNISVVLGFRRAKLEYVYSLLRGKDLQTNQFSDEQREKQFAILKESQGYALNLQNWHDFFSVLKRAGYTTSQIISSQITILYTYALWLIGKRDFKVDLFRLRETLARWFFMASLTGRYTASPESRMEQDMFHALPEKWYEMDYNEFLKERRKRMAEVIRLGFMKIKDN